MASAFVAELVLTFFFLMIILGATDKRAPAGFAPIAIGLGLTLIHLIGIPVTNLSVNPARSVGPALIKSFFGGDNTAIGQVWLFWVAPAIGAGLAGACAGVVLRCTTGVCTVACGTNSCGVATLTCALVCALTGALTTVATFAAASRATDLGTGGVPPFGAPTVVAPPTGEPLIPAPGL